MIKSCKGKLLKKKKKRSTGFRHRGDSLHFFNFQLFQKEAKGLKVG